MTNVNIWSAAA